MHGVVMVFFFLIPSIPAALGNFFLPMMIGARDLAFPKLNLLSWYLYMIGGAVQPVRRCSPAASTPAGRSTRRTARTYSNSYVIADRARASSSSGFSSILTGLNFIVTVHRMRAPGHDLVPPAAVRLVDTTPPASSRCWARRCWRSPSCCWSCERVFHIGIFDPALRRRPGALPAPVLVLLAPGRVHHGAAGHGRDQRTGLGASRASRSSATASWRSRAWPSRCSASWSGATTCSSAASRCTPAWSSRSSATSSRSRRPSRCSTGPRRCTRARSPSQTPMLYAFGFIGLFTIGGLTGLFLAALAIDVHVHRHLLRRGALPLHHGGRHGHGLPRRPALLVAEDDRPHVPRRLGASSPR